MATPIPVRRVRCQDLTFDLPALVITRELLDPAPSPTGGPAREAVREPVPVPAQLPPAVPAFTGRRTELAVLDALGTAGEPARAAARYVAD
jgi:hypothetical protein